MLFLIAWHPFSWIPYVFNITCKGKGIIWFIVESPMKHNFPISNEPIWAKIYLQEMKGENFISFRNFKRFSLTRHKNPKKKKLSFTLLCLQSSLFSGSKQKTKTTNLAKASWGDQLKAMVRVGVVPHTHYAIIEKPIGVVYRINTVHFWVEVVKLNDMTNYRKKGFSVENLFMGMEWIDRKKESVCVFVCDGSVEYNTVPLSSTVMSKYWKRVSPVLLSHQNTEK